MPNGSSRSIDLTGRRSGRLVALHKQTIDDSGNSYWMCQCDCGAKVSVRSTLINKGHTQSCGCLNREAIAAKCRTHGRYGTSEYNAWNCLKQRCNNPKDRGYKDYGARGISISERWATFEAFFQDMGPKPSPRHSLDRINNNGNYEPSNCRWATASEQNRNKRPKTKVHR